ncbi:4'-phosphopantetheinyl transferase superfamily protein [Tissierella creatinini]|nr:4'-phosphopantetheinyl transferase superfamily protein [Tissierella creatinini]TJX62224.1 4'-phosphopantetheinyl transferase superfamily protein [Soehngenia saccharolytica]
MINIYIEEAMDPKMKSEIFIRWILSEYLKVDRDELNIKKTKYGKPYLVDYPYVHFNVTHTKDMIAGAISDNPIGIDMERIKPRPHNKRIAEKFLTKNEQKYIFHRKDNQDLRFLEVWTRKEAYVKWAGLGMKLSFDTFDVLDDDRIITTFINEYIFSICSDCFIDWKDDESFSFCFNEKSVYE